MPNNNNDKTQNQNEKIQPQKDKGVERENQQGNAGRDESSSGQPGKFDLGQKQGKDQMSQGIGRQHQSQKGSTDIERQDSASRQVGNDNDPDRDLEDQDEAMPEQGQQKVGSGQQQADRDRK
jgi:hypothetical protein